MELSLAQAEAVMKRFPSFELSYETLSHKKVSPIYNSCLAIPQGKKCYLWFTFLGEHDVCFLLDLNRDKKIVKMVKTDISCSTKLAFGTVMYGTMLEENREQSVFLIEDLFYAKGISMQQCVFYQKLDFMVDCMEEMPKTSVSVLCRLPVFWEVTETKDFDLTSHIPDNTNIPYPIHHLQYRALFQTAPYLNVYLNKKLNIHAPVVAVPKQMAYETTKIVCDYSKPQYKYPTTFQVMADLQFDIYHLFAYGVNNKPVYYGIASIPNYKCSVFMNGLFRLIKENKNLDYIEESDDEEEFQNVAEDKYVDLEKMLVMECSFHSKFKKWVPLRVVPNTTKIVHITRLNKDTVQDPYRRSQHRPHYNQRSFASK